MNDAIKLMDDLIAAGLLYKYERDIGGILIGFSDSGIVIADWLLNKRILKNINRVANKLIVPTQDQLHATVNEIDNYFNGQKYEFSFNIDLSGTDFEKSVWKELMTLGHGETITYGELAVRIGRKEATRAVASAVGRNIVSIIIPCHRVIAAGNKIGGYAGGIDTKRYLLGLEKPMFNCS